MGRKGREGEGRGEGEEGEGREGEEGGEGKERGGKGRKQRRGKGSEGCMKEGYERLAGHACMVSFHDAMVITWYMCILHCMFTACSAYTIYCVHSIQARQCPSQSLVNESFTSAPILNCKAY